MVSPISELLDYLVIRDNITCDTKNNLIKLNSDNIRYQNIAQDDVSGKKFSFENKYNFNLENLKVIGDKDNLLFDLIIEKDPNIFTVKFK